LIAEWSLRLPKLLGDERVELESREQCFDARAEPRVNATEILSGLSADAAVRGFFHAGEDADMQLVDVGDCPDEQEFLVDTRVVAHHASC
jgi:hypothetical protein